jgi:hypothetical protein
MRAWDIHGANIRTPGRKTDGTPFGGEFRRRPRRVHVLLPVLLTVARAVARRRRRRRTRAALPPDGIEIGRVYVCRTINITCQAHAGEG